MSRHTTGSFALMALERRNPLLQKHASHLLRHNLRGGKRIRSKLVIGTARCYPSVVSMAPLLDAIEVLQAGFLVADDCCDKARLRRGRPSWRIVVKDDNQAWNDANLLCLCSKAVICDNYHMNPSHAFVSQAFDDCILQTVSGQHHDMNTPANLDPHAYRRLVALKTGMYTFWLPIVSSMALNTSEVPNSTVLRATEEISATFAELYQGHNDIANELERQPKENPLDRDLNRPTWVRAYGLNCSKPETIKDEFHNFVRLKMKQATEEALYINEVTGKLLGTRIISIVSQHLLKSGNEMN